MSKKPTADRVRELLCYDPATGSFTWLTLSRCGNGRVLHRPGDIAGCRNTEGRNVIRVDGKLHYGYRLAWLYITGEWPARGIDHRDCDCTNDIWTNLREADQSQNNCNARRRRDSSTGYKGVYFDKRERKYVARVVLGGKTHRLGAFKDAHAAHLAYRQGAESIHGEFARQ